MKVEFLKEFKLAINPREVVNFRVGQKLITDRYINKSTLRGLANQGVVKVINELENKMLKVEVKKQYDLSKYRSKKDLERFAKEELNIELDSSISFNKMKSEVKKLIND